MSEARPNLALMGFAAVASANVLVLGFATVVLRIALGRTLAQFGVDSPDRLWLEGGGLGYVLLAFAVETVAAGALGAVLVPRLARVSVSPTTPP
ncbi:MAG: hypothetical protein HOO96_14930 [Polyangiaceae bacterium]|nr:hypothetical protein [Polyangiaceae bacterium]